MPSIKDILEPVEEKVKAIYNTKDIAALLYEVDTLISELNWWGEISKPFEAYTLQELSVTSGKLAVMRSSLLHFKDEAYKNLKRLQASRDLMKPAQREQVIKFLVDKANSTWWKQPTQWDIEAMLDKQLATLNYEISLHEAQLEKFNSYWYMIPDILHRIETRIKVLEWDAKTSKFYDFDVWPTIQ